MNTYVEDRTSVLFPDRRICPSWKHCWKLCVLLGIALMSSWSAICAQDNGDGSEITTNSSGYTVRHIVRTKTGNIDQWYEGFHDAEGKVLVAISKNADGTIKLVRHFVYNKDNNVQEICAWDGKGELTKRVVYIYDKTGAFVEGQEYNARGRRFGTEHTPPSTFMYGGKTALKKGR